MDYTCIFFGVLFTLGGFVFATGNGHSHLSAWKNMPPEGFSDHWFVGAMVAWMIIAGFDVWYIEKSQRYRKK